MPGSSKGPHLAAVAVRWTSDVSQIAERMVAPLLDLFISCSSLGYSGPPAWSSCMCGRPRRSKGDLVCAPRSGAVMCPAYVARPYDRWP
jgi:hypothetical protein